MELLAALHAIKSFVKTKHVKHVLIFMDNQVALAYLNKKGGTKCPVMSSIAKKIWLYAEEKNFSITGMWIASKENLRADFLSRVKESAGDWMLLPSIFQEIKKKWGSPSIDAFASLAMHQMNPYWSWRPDPEAKATDAMLQDWRTEFPYIFPPFCLINRILKKVVSQRVGKANLIAPLWQGQTWFPKIMELLVGTQSCSRIILKS